MTKPRYKTELYRPAAGVAIFNRHGQVWLGRRAGEQSEYVWQFPQGGIDPGESAEYAAIREMEEETGISVQNVAPLGRVDKELFYTYPADIEKNSRTRLWQGQRQSWFALRFTGHDAHINIKATQPQEFSEWKWGNLSDTPQLIIPFKREVYERLAIEFDAFAKPVK